MSAEENVEENIEENVEENVEENPEENVEENPEENVEENSEENPEENIEETLHWVAATTIQKTWRSYLNRQVYKYFKDLICLCNQGDPQKILKTVNPREAELLDAAAGVFIRFRLGGITFPPNIYYKIFTYRPITDVCASSPRDYTKPGLKKPAVWPLTPEDRSGWYQRMENNSWRLFCRKMVPKESMEIGSDKKMDFHYSRLQRQQDVDMWRKTRKVEWLKQMYSHGRVQSLLVGSSTREEKDAAEDKGDEEMPECELDELLAWSDSLNFEEYMSEWRLLACSQSSEPSKDPRGFPGFAAEQ